jgi:WD40-like Beta Propeller Repeat
VSGSLRPFPTDPDNTRGVRRRRFGSRGVVAIVALVIALALIAAGIEAAYRWAVGPIAQAPDSGPVPAVALPARPVVAAWEYIDATSTVVPPGVASLVYLVVVDDRSQVDVLPTPLTDACHHVLSGLVLSPDGTRVAVVGSLDCGAPPFTQSVRVVDVVHDRVVTTLPGGDGGVAWSPDSTRLIIANIHRPGDITTQSGTVLGHVPTGFEPHWTPSSLIALSVYDAHNTVVVFRGDATRVTELSGYQSGRWISGNRFAGARGDVADVVDVDSTGKSPVTVVRTYPCPLGPISPDAKTMVGYATPTVGAVRNSATLLQSCDVVTGQLKRLSPNYGASELEGAAWLPDGLIAALIGPTYQTIDARTGRHRIFAHTDRSSSLHYFAALTTVAG